MATAPRTTLALVAVPVALAAITTFVALDPRGPASLARHAYVVPVAAAALRFGVLGGSLAAGAAMLLMAPLVLPVIERSGLTPATAEGLVSLAVLAALGTLVGGAMTRARREQARHEALVAVRSAVAGAGTLDEALARLRAVLADRLEGDVALIVRDGDRTRIAGGGHLAPGSAAARVLATGRALFVVDASVGPRPRRVFVTPLVAETDVVGVLAVEREGELGAGERAVLEALGAHVGVALENARLAARQRRFADELAEKVASATAQLAEIDRAKSAFVAIASHELRTPLTALQGFSELLTLRRLAPEEVVRFARIMHGEARRLARIVDDLLDLSRIEQGLAPALYPTAVDVRALVADVVEVLRRAAPNHPIEVECDADLPALHADPNALERILTNLVGNAVKYSPPGRAVRVQARRAAAGVALVVEDQGRGIPAHALPRVFDAYYRVPGAVPAARGAGIGLAVVRALVAAHGGTIHLESTPGVGTRATVTLPAVP